MATLSAIIHGSRRDGRAVLKAVDQVLGRLPEADEERAVNYIEYVRSLLRSDRARQYLEALLNTATFPYHNSFTRKYEAKGEAKGEANALLRMLRNRGITVSTTVHERITGCRDLDQLGTWIDRAMTADNIHDVLDD